MAGIADFVQMAAQSLGQPEDSTRSATAALLGGLKDKADPGDFSQLMQAIPGASDLLGGGGESSSGGGGLLGGLMGQASSALGGDLGSKLGLLAGIQKSGFSMDQIGPLVKLFVGFAKSNAGEGLVQKLLGQVPELGELAG